MLAILLLAAGCLHGQPSGAAGTTVDQTGKPLAGVHVRLITGDFNSGGGVESVYGANSDSAGHFSLDGMKPGLYLVMAERTGFFQQSASGFTTVSLKPGQQLTDYKIVMLSQAVITGHVTDEYGDPVQGAAVQTQAADSKQQMNIMFGGRNAMTDDRGEFRLVTSPGKYYLKASHFNQRGGRTEIRTDGTQGGPFIPTYFPSAAVTGTASVVEVAAGQEVAGIDIRLLRATPGTPGSPGHAFTISGMVIGAPEDGRATVVLHFGETTPQRYNTRATNVDAEGKFSIGGMQPGFYSVSAAYVNGKTALQSRAMEFHLDGADQTGLQLSLGPPEELTGKLELVGDAPQADKRTVRLENVEFQFGQASNPSVAEVAQDGTFRITGVLPGKFKAVVEPMPENGYLKDVTLDGHTVPDRVLDFSQGVGGAKLKITVSRTGGQISGRVLGKDNEPAAGLIMVFIATDSKHMEEDNASRTFDGKYSFKAIRPGKYRLVAVDIGEMIQAFSGDGNSEESLQRLFDAGEEIEVKEGDRLTKDIAAMTKMPEKKEAP